MSEEYSGGGPIPRVTLAKLVLAIGGAAVFFSGIRWDSPTVRWIGIGIVGIGWALRFATRKRAESDDEGPPSD
ncbi:MAG: hypothetical protein O2973_12465 [Gemmatimonadetes bacterium]|nr:hypothetical protein [Gemmatimonadota bacterium]